MGRSVARRARVSANIWGSRSWYDLNSVYTGPPSALPPLFRTEYARTPARPIFLIEARYENLSDWTPGMLRYQAYQPYLTGAMGQVFGNEPIWHAGGSGFTPPPPFTWQQALDLQGSEDMARHLEQTSQPPLRLRSPSSRSAVRRPSGTNGT